MSLLLKHDWYVARLLPLAYQNKNSGSNFTYGYGGSLQETRSKAKELGDDYTFLPSEYVEDDLIQKNGESGAILIASSIDKPPIF